MTHDPSRSSFTSNSTDYELGQQIGFGASAIVYSAVFRPPSGALGIVENASSDHDQPESSAKLSISDSLDAHPSSEEVACAIKVSSLHSDMGLLFKEIKMLSMCRHPNVLRILATFTLPPDHHRVALVTPLVSGGSLAGILDWRSRLAGTPKHNHAPRFGLRRKQDEDFDAAKGILDEEEIKAVVKQVLEGLVYLHSRSFIHRDVKAGNVLVEGDGTVLLADFGVGGDMNDPLTPKERPRPGMDHFQFKPVAGITVPPLNTAAALVDESGKRTSFVGTPSWMAPEVVLQQEYDGRADIWSLGITIIELALGASPGAKNKTNKVLRNTVSEPAPTLDKHSHRFGKGIKDFVASCLEKDPADRPTAAQLLDHQWIKGAKKKAFLAESLLAGIPPIEARQELRRVPSVSSLVSRASSWDFSTTPTLSVSPTRSSSHIPLRSPSIASQMQGYFPDNVTRSHSRTSTMIPSIPPSPRVSLKQWAEMTAPERSGSDWRRSASEQGTRRNSTLRRGQSASFDIGTASWSESSGSRIRQRSIIESGSAMSPLAESSFSPQLLPLIGSPPEMPGPLQLSGLMIRDSAPVESTKTSASKNLSQSPTSPTRSVASTSTSQQTAQTSSTKPARPTILTDDASLALRRPVGAAVEAEKEKESGRGRRGWLGRKGDEKGTREKSEHRWPGMARRLTERLHRK